MRRLFMPTIFAVLILLLSCILPMKANAATEGYYTYTVSNGEATIIDCNTFISGNVTIPATLGGYPVTSIGSSAFSGCSRLTSITIPDSVTSIGKVAFAYCEKLTSITIPDSVTSIGESAFFGCSGLTGITIPDSVTSISESAFYDCRRLNSITIPDGVTSIGESAFSYCTSLTSITIPDSVISIGSGAFSYCSSLTSIDFGENSQLTSINSYAFSCCSLTSITIPDSVTSIGDSAFEGCYSLIDLYITDVSAWLKIRFENDDSNPVKYVGNLHVLDDAGNEVTQIELDNTVTAIPARAFNNAKQLTNISIPVGVTSIANDAFFGCTNLTSVIFGDNSQLTSIGDSAFYECSNLTGITIPNSVTGIGEYAFFYCTSLTSVTFEENSQLTSIGDSAFWGCSSLESITIPSRVATVGDGAFSWCSHLTSITIPDSVTSIGAYTFCECSSLTDVYYAGADTQWQSIGIGPDNTNLTGATIHYSHIHDYFLLDTVTVVPTCEKVGYIEYTCVYGDKYKKYIPAIGHEYSIKSGTVQSSCTEQGYTEYKCIRCDSTEMRDWTYAIGHDYSIKGKTVQPTCTEQGYTEYQCVRCGITEIGDWWGPLGHDYTGAEKTVDPTCTQSGSFGHTCIRCGDYQAEHTFAALGHKMVRLDAKEPTCTEVGNSVGTQCSRCQMYGVQPEIIAALGHLEVIEPAVPATCTNAGLTEGKYCSRCREILIAQEVENALGHYVLQGGKELVDSYSTQNDETYPFAVVDGWYESTNKDHKTTSIYTISAVYDCTLVLKYKVSSESNYDKLQILVNSTTKDTISGSVSEKTMTLTLKTGDCVYIKYAKDVSVSKNADTGYFKIYSCTQTEINTTVRVSTDDIEPTCAQSVVCADCKQTIKEAPHSLENGICTVCGYKTVDLKITSVALRPEAAGLYFTGSFEIAEDVDILRKGIVVSVFSSMPVADGSDPNSRWSVGTTSVLVKNILSEKVSDASNQNRAAMYIYARAYAELADGTYVYSDVVAVNLQEVVEAADAQWATLDATQKEAFLAMYAKFKTDMETWNIPNVKKA